MTPNLNPFVVNAALLLAMAVVYDLLILSRRETRSRVQLVLLGGGLGLICIAVMSAPLELQPGLIFDTRSVLLCVSGLFFGNVATIIAMAVAAAFRLLHGGIGDFVGVSVILTSGALGLLARSLHKRSLAEVSIQQLLVLGITVHVAMLLWMLLLPRAMIAETIATIALPVLTIYPATTVAMGMLMRNRTRWHEAVVRVGERENFAKLLFSESPLPQIILEPDTLEVADCNHAAIYTFGLRNRTELVGEALPAWMGHGSDQMLFELLNEASSDTQLSGLGHSPDAHGHTLLLQTKDDREWEAQPWIGRFVHEGRRYVHLGLADTTEASRARKQLQESEDRFRKAITEAPIPIMLHAEDGEIVFVSEAWCEITGYRQEELPTTRAWARFAYGDDAHAVMQKIQETYGFNARVHEGDFRIRTRRGDERIWNLSSGPLGKLPDGRRLVISTATDVTERHLAEAEVLALNAELERRVQERTQQVRAAYEELESFSYAVSHDLRAPLRAMGSFAQVLEEHIESSLDERGQHYLRRIKQNADKMSVLIDDLLNLSRLSRQSLRREQLDITTMAKECMEGMRAAEPRAAYECEIEEGISAFADRGLTRILLMNLIQNAWKFSSAQPIRKLAVGSNLNGGENVYFVRDNGTGFDMKHADLLYLPFRRLHLEHEHPGTGIGLATVDRIVRRHGGRIWAESAPGRGATFFWTLAAQEND